MYIINKTKLSRLFNCIRSTFELQIIRNEWRLDAVILSVMKLNSLNDKYFNIFDKKVRSRVRHLSFLFLFLLLIINKYIVKLHINVHDQFNACVVEFAGGGVSTISLFETTISLNCFLKLGILAKSSGPTIIFSILLYGRC